MGFDKGKYYDARKTAEYFNTMKQSASFYETRARAVFHAYDEFVVSESFLGELANACKKLVKSGLYKMLQETLDIHTTMINIQNSVIFSFESMVDPAQDARIEYDTLEVIDRDFKNLYHRYDAISNNVKHIVSAVQAEFGGYAYFEQPDSKTAKTQFIKLCGGEQENGGHIKDSQKKFVLFDMVMKSKLKGMDIPDHTDSITMRLKNAAPGLLAIMGAAPGKPAGLFSIVLGNCLKNINAGSGKYHTKMIKQATLVRPDNVSNMKIGEDYSNVLYMPEPGEVIEVSLGTDHEPPTQTATVSKTHSWAIEYTIKGANAKFPPNKYKSTRVLNYVVDNYETNAGQDDLLKVQIPGYGECYAGAMVAGFGSMGDIVKVTLDNGETFNMVLLDTKCITHTDAQLGGTQCQNYWGHGYMLDDQTVQMCVCEFIAAGDTRNNSAKQYPSGQDLLTDRYVVSAEIVGHIDTCD